MATKQKKRPNALGQRRDSDARAPVVQSQQFKSASEFLRALDPTKAPWTKRNWIFRGHESATYKLLPSAFRDESWEPYRLPPVGETEMKRWRAELGLLADFANAADRVGIALPGIQSPRTIEELRFSEGPQWPEQYSGLVALAQHHRVPTRLLDFTERASVAAYFAAQDPSKPAKALCVWALDADFLRHGVACDGIWFAMIRAHRATNPNLHAQSGVFVTWTGPADIHPLDKIIARVVSGRIRSRIIGTNPPDLPVMRRLVLPRQHADELLRLLAYQRVTAATMFPGVDGVIRELKERPRLRKDWGP